MQRDIDGILLTDKRAGQTSYDVIRGIKSLMIGATGRKFGHAGTLDPFATGLLIILLGQGTKLSSFLTALEKTYRATMRLGIETDTMDLTGKEVSRKKVPEFSVDDIRGVAGHFVGTLEQEPPAYSALRVHGKRAYDLARKGLTVRLEKRLVRVERIQVLGVDLPDVTLEVTCSKGTYVRRLASDIGASLGPGAHLRGLRRLSIGPFRAADAVKVGDTEQGWQKAELTRRVIPLRAALPHLPEIIVDETIAAEIRHGRQPHWGRLREAQQNVLREGLKVRVVHGQELVAVARIQQTEEAGVPALRIERVFTSPKTNRDMKEV